MEIYLDVLFLENIVMNYLILTVTERFSKVKTTSFRIFTGALIGALYVILLVLLPDLKIYYTAIAKILLSFAMVAIAFPIQNLKVFLKALVIFYVSTFIFAGAAFAFLYVNNGGGFVRNGMIYFFWQSKWNLLFFATATVGIIIRVFWDVIQLKFIRDKLMIQLKIVFENKDINIDALIDTGNSLHDPLTNMPVIIVEYRVLKEILPLDIQKIFTDSTDENLDTVIKVVSNSEWFGRFRLIPFTSLGKENGMLFGFKPDFIEICSDEKVIGIKDIIVGIYNKALSKNQSYSALIGPDLI